MFVAVKSNYIDQEGKAHTSMKTVATIRTDSSAAEQLMKLKFHKNNDYYITANSFSGSDRKYSSLYQLKNIVIDIDCHMKLNRDDVKLRDAMLKNLTSIVCSPICEDYGLPHPNAAVYTGRGVQFWFRLEDCSARLKDAYKPAVRYLEACLIELMNDHISFIGDACTIDGTASVKPSGLFRLPCTYNSKTGTKVSVEIYHDAPVDILDLHNKEKHISKSTQNQSAKYSGWMGDPDALGWFRYEALTTILENRVSQKALIERDKFLFFTYCSFCDSSLEDEQIFNLLEEMNSKFPIPMPEREWKKYLSTAMRKHYHYTNTRIIEDLAITETEQELVGFYPTNMKKRAKGVKKHWDKDTKAVERICQLCKKGRTKKEIAIAVGCSEQTVGRILAKKKLRTTKEKITQKAWRKAVKGAAVVDLIALGISRSYAYALVKRAADEIRRRSNMLEKAKQIREKKDSYDGTISFSGSRRPLFYRQRILEIPYYQNKCSNNAKGAWGGSSPPIAKQFYNTINYGTPSLDG